MIHALAVLAFAAAPLRAAPAPPSGGAMLAVTVAARPSLARTPSAGQRLRSRAFLDSGMAALRAGRAQRAVQDFNDAVRLAPGAETFKALGAAYEAAGDRLKAAWAYQESLRFAPDAQVRARLAALASRKSGGGRAYKARLGRARDERRAGADAAALGDYLKAYRLNPGAEAGGPCLELASRLAAQDLGQGRLAEAMKVLVRVQAPLKGTPADAEPGARAALAAETARAQAWSGMSLRDAQKAMLADPAGWTAKLRARAADADAPRLP